MFDGPVEVPEDSGSFELCVSVETQGQIELLEFSIELQVTDGLAS